MTDNVGNRKLSGLMAYLDSLVKKGRVRASVVTPLKTAVRKIFETVLGDEWGDVEVENIDLDDYMLRFQNLALDRYNSDSYNTYKARANRALNWYSNFLRNPGWTPTIRKSASVDTKKTSDEGNNSAKKDNGMAKSIPSVGISGHTQTGLISFPFPMSDGTMASLYLPRRIDSKDAKRLANFISSLVVEGRCDEER